MHIRITAKGRGERGNRSELRKRRPHDQPGQQSANRKDRDEQAVSEKPLARFFAHRRKDFGVDDRVVNTADCFKET